MIYLKIAVTLVVIVVICGMISSEISRDKPWTYEADKAYQVVTCVGVASFIGTIVTGFWWLWTL